MNSRMGRPEEPVLITGCSSGIGLATALLLARLGYRVVATVKSLEEQGTIREDIHREGLEIDILPMDNTSEESVREGFHYLDMTYDGLHGLVNNAGVGAGGFFEDVTEENLRAHFEVNFFGTARVTRFAIPLLRRRNVSYLVTITSMAGRLGVPGMSSYHSAKFALEGMCECLYHELRPHGVRVAIVEPGLIKTSILKNGFVMSGVSRDSSSVYSERAERIWQDFQDRFERNGGPPEVVARIIAGILSRRDPGLRHAAGTDARVILGLWTWLPEWVRLRLLGRFAG